MNSNPSSMSNVNSKNDNTLLFIIIGALAILWLTGFFNPKDSKKKKENYSPMTRNFPYTNKNDIADKLEYGEIEEPAINPKGDNKVMGPSSNTGVNKNSPTDVFDRRGFKWTVNAKNPLIDEITEQSDNQQLRKNFERTYMLDPEGKTAQYDITYNTISPNCCPAQYAPPFPLTKNNCDYAQKYVANQYSGMNFKDGYGCTCMTKDQAKFYGNRGNNTE